MTPLAHQILKQLLLPQQRRTFDDRGNLLDRMRDVHYFDCRQVGDVAINLAIDSKDFGDLSETFAFLPAPKTWIEFKTGPIEFGCLLIEDREKARVHLATRTSSAFGSWNAFLELPLRGATSKDLFLVGPEADLLMRNFQGELGPAAFIWSSIVGCLALINSHRTIGRKQHLPHAGLQRDIARKFKGKGEFRFHAWTEILLDVCLPSSSDLTEGEKSQEVHLSGARARHFVRKYMRVRRGQVEIVSSHWRGDESLGIKQATYRVVPGPGAEQE